MPVPTISPSLQSLQTEYGDPNGADVTIPLNLFYAGRTVVPNPPPSSAYGTIPVWAGSEAASGAISIGVFRGTQALTAITVTIAANATNVSMRQLAVNAGWSTGNILDLTVIINAGVTVYSDTNAVSAMATKATADPAFPAGSVIRLYNYGTIAGAGGPAGSGGTVVGPSVGAAGNGATGGTGFNANAPVIVYNYGVIGGGGGGGGGGAAIYTVNNSKKPASYGAGGGGGGGGRVNGLAGAGGSATGNDSNTGGVAGTAGTLSTFGTAGAGGLVATLVQGGGGGAGGDLGQPGANGSPASNINALYTPTFGSAGIGGAAGPAIISGTNIQWGAFGTILGAGFVTSYTISRSTATVNEGGSVTFTLNGTIPAGASIPYTITGISSADIGGASLTGSFTSAAPSRTLTLSADSLTEGTETITIRLNNPSTPATVMPSQTCTVSDTSVSAGGVLGSSTGTWSSWAYSFDTTPPFDYPVARITLFSDGQTGVNDNNSNLVLDVNWYSPTTPSIGNSYWVRATSVGTIGAGTLSGTFGTWVSLGTSQTWSVTKTTTGAYGVSVTFELSTSPSGSPIVAIYSNCSLEAEFNT